MRNEQLNTFWLTAEASLQAAITSGGIDLLISRLQEAIQSFREPLSADDLLSLAKLYAIRQDLQVQILGIEPRVFVRLGRGPEALAIARFQQGTNHKLSSLAAVYEALTELGHPDFALLDELAVLVQQIEGIENQITSRYRFGRMLAEAGRFDEAVQVARSIPRVDHGLESRSSVLFTIAAYLSRASHHTQAVEILAEAQARYREIDAAWDAVEVLIDQLLEAGKGDQQNDLPALLRQIQDKLDDPDYPNRDLWLTQTASNLVKAHHPELAEPFFAQVIEAVRKIQDTDQKIQSYCRLIEALATGDFLSDAQTLLNELTRQAETNYSRFTSSYVFTAQVAVFTAQGRIEQAREAAQKIIPSWRISVLNRLAVALVEKGQQTEAGAVLNEIGRAVQQTMDWGQRAEALTAMALVWHNGDSAPGADFLFQKATEAVRRNRQQWPGRMGQEEKNLIRALAQTGRFTQAREVAMHELPTIRGHIWGFEKASCDIALAAVQSGHNVNTVLSEVEHLTAGSETVLKDVALVYVAAGRLADARRTFDKAIELTRARMRQSSRQLGYHAYSDLLAALDRSGFTDQSDALLDEAIQIARESTDSIWHPRLLYHMAICLAQKGRLEQAVSLIAEADTASETRIYAEQSEVWATIALSLARAGKHQEAEATFARSWESAWRMAVDDIQEREAREDAMYQVAELMCEAGYISQARTVAFKLERGWGSNILRDLATVLVKSGNYTEALQIIGTDLCEHFLVREPDKFLQTLAEWSVNLDQLQPGLTMSILQETTRIFGWVFEDWHEVYQALADLPAH